MRPIQHVLVAIDFSDARTGYDETTVKARLKALVRFLETIQEK